MTNPLRTPGPELLGEIFHLILGLIDPIAPTEPRHLEAVFRHLDLSRVVLPDGTTVEFNGYSFALAAQPALHLTLSEEAAARLRAAWDRRAFVLTVEAQQAAWRVGYFTTPWREGPSIYEPWRRRYPW